MDAERSRIQVDQPSCPFCRSEIAAGEAQLACNACRAWHHRECWAENSQRCSACGCQETGLAAEPTSPTAAAPASVPAAPAPAPAPRPRAGPVRYRTSDGRTYEYRVPFGAWALQQLGLVGLGGLLAAPLVAANAYGVLPPLLVAMGIFLVIAVTFAALKWHDVRSRTYLDP